jgi:hypothetical protein
MLFCILYVVACYVILLLRKTLKEFMKMFGHSLYYSRLVILSSFHSKQDSLLTSEKPFSSPRDKINYFSVFEAQPSLFN